MKRKALAIILCLAIVFLNISMAVSAATTYNIIFFVQLNSTDNIEVVTNNNLSSGKTYSADIVLPVGVKYSDVYLSWSTNANSVKKKVSTSWKTQTSGQTAIAAVGSSMSLRVYLTSTSYCTFNLTTKQQSLPELNFKLNKNDSGLFCDCTAVESSGGSTSFIETFTGYLPGNAKIDYSKASLSWDNADKVELTDLEGNVCTSGSTQINPDSDTVFNAKFSGVTGTYTYTVKTSFIKGSEKVDSVNFTIDESLGTISAMNTDQNHETECYGTIDIDGKSYFISMKGRGNYTWYDPSKRRFQEKKPYNFTLMKDDTYEKKIDKKQELVPGAKSKKWSLLANYADSSLLRNKIGYDLADKMGIGLKSRFVDVWMNGEFLGNYLLTPKSDYQASDDGYVLEYDNKKEKEGGDIQFKLDGIDSFGTSSYNFFSIKNFGDNAKQAAIDAGYDYIEDEYGNVLKDETYLYIQKWMQEMLDAVKNTETDDYLDYIDVDSWAKMYIIYEIVKNYDVISGSQFMYRSGTGKDDKLYAGPIWDLDNAFDRSGNCDYDGISNTTLEHSASGSVIDSITTQAKTFSLLQALGKHADFMERVYQNYNDYKSDINDLSSNVDTLKNDILESANMNFERWNINQTNYNNSYFGTAQTFDSGKTYQYKRIATKTYDNYVDNLKNYLKARANYLEVTWGVTNPDASVTGDVIYNKDDEITFTATSGFDGYKWQISEDGTAWTDIDGETNNVFMTKAVDELNGKLIRCVVKTKGSLISTSGGVASVNTSAVTYAEISDVIHIHSYIEITVLPTETEEGYTAKQCECGDIIDKVMISVIKYGDVNSDLSVDVCDCVAVLLYINKSKIFTVSQFAASDVNCDGVVDDVDLDLIAKYAIGLIDVF